MLIKGRLNSTSTDSSSSFHQALIVFSSSINLILLMSQCCDFLGVSKIPFKDPSFLACH